MDYLDAWIDRLMRREWKAGLRAGVVKPESLARTLVLRAKSRGLTPYPQVQIEVRLREMRDVG